MICEVTVMGHSIPPGRVTRQLWRDRDEALRTGPRHLLFHLFYAMLGMVCLGTELMSQGVLLYYVPIRWTC